MHVKKILSGGKCFEALFGSRFPCPGPRRYVVTSSKGAVPEGRTVQIKGAAERRHGRAELHRLKGLSVEVHAVGSAR